MKLSNTKERLVQLMQTRGLKQSDILGLAKTFCRMYDVKLTKSDLSQYVAGKTQPNQGKLFILSKALNVSEAWLMGFDVPMERHVTDRSVDLSEGVPFDGGDICRIPILGNVIAGSPCEAVECIEGYVDIPSDWVRGGAEFFALKVKGDSMEPRMFEGDVVIVRKQSTVSSGQIAIVLVENSEATIKKVFIDERGITLKAFNEEVFSPKSYSKKEVAQLPVLIIGLVVQVRADLF